MSQAHLHDKAILVLANKQVHPHGGLGWACVRGEYTWFMCRACVAVWKPLIHYRVALGLTSLCVNF